MRFRIHTLLTLVLFAGMVLALVGQEQRHRVREQRLRALVLEAQARSAIATANHARLLRQVRLRSAQQATAAAPGTE